MSIIVAAVDHSPTARSVLETARLLAVTFGLQAEALHVIEPGEERLSFLPASGMTVRMLAGDPVEAICGALDADVALAVLGARRGAAGPVPTSHVVADVLRRSTTPIVVVPPEAWEHLPRRLGKALVPLDAATAETPIVQAAVELLAKAGVEVVVLHVMEEPPRFLNHPERDLTDWVDGQVARHLPVTVRVEVRAGSPVRHVLMTAAAERVDLVVLAWHRQLAADHAPVVRDALTRACVPVLLLDIDAQATALAGLAAGIPVT